MGIAYQLTFFLALTLLAIVITIFVFAVSLLGRAVEVASREQEKTTREQKDATEREIAEMQKQVSALVKKKRIGQELRELEKRLKQLRKQDKNFEKKLSRIGRAPELLRVKGAVIHPSICLGIALILTGVAWHLSIIGIPTAPVIIWGLGLAAIGYSIYRIYCSLKTVESVAITSEEAALKRTVEAYKISHKELEEERKPKLVLIFRNGNPPFHIGTGEELAIKFSLSLIQGDIARKPIVYFFAPPGFDFPGRHTWLQDEYVTTVGGHITTELKLEDCRRGISPLRIITLKATSDKGSFSLRYKLTCEGFDSDFEKFEVIVE